MSDAPTQAQIDSLTIDAEIADIVEYLRSFAEGERGRFSAESMDGIPIGQKCDKAADLITRLSAAYFNLVPNYETAQANWDLTLDRAEKAEAERDELISDMELTRDGLNKAEADLAGALQRLAPFARFADALDAAGGDPVPDTLPISTAPIAPLPPDDPHPLVGDCRAARDFVAKHKEPK